MKTTMISCHNSIKSQSINFFIIGGLHQQERQAWGEGPARACVGAACPTDTEASRGIARGYLSEPGSVLFSPSPSASSSGKRLFIKANLWMASSTVNLVCPETHASMSSEFRWLCRKRCRLLSDSSSALWRTLGGRKRERSEVIGKRGRTARGRERGHLRKAPPSLLSLEGSKHCIHDALRLLKGWEHMLTSIQLFGNLGE